jgi:hypothetical protein
MLATDGLWFSYQDERTLKGLTLISHASLSPGWWGRTAAANRRCL